MIYNPEYWQRDGHQPLEIYKLINGCYELQIGEPFWMPEIGLGIGRYRATFGTVQQEVLGWYDHQGVRYLTPEERAERLAARLKELGEDPDRL